MINVRAPRPITRRSIVIALVYGVKVALCTVILTYGFQRMHRPGLLWALVSAVLVLQPGLEQSIQASLTRIAANMIGASAGLCLGAWSGETTVSVIVALASVIAICEVLRLDWGVRTACASTIIVMLVSGGDDIVRSGLQRMMAVIVGCVVATFVQFGGEPLRRSSLIRNWVEADASLCVTKKTTRLSDDD